MALSGSLIVLALLLPGQQSAAELYEDFRGRRIPEGLVKLVGPNVRQWVNPEEEGLRFNLPADRPPAPLGVHTEFPITGDFEITATYEVLDAEQPKKGYGVGVNITFSPDAEQVRRGTLARFRLASGESGLLVRCKNPGGTDLTPRIVPADVRGVGRFRFKREGATVRFLVADGLQDDFQQLHEFDYGTDSVGLVRFVVNTGNVPAAIDARLIDLRIRCDSIPGVEATAAPAATTRSSLPLLLALSAAVLLMTGLFLFWLWRRRVLVQPVKS